MTSNLSARMVGILWLRANGAPIYDTDGSHVGNLAMYTDITKQKQAEEVLSFQARLLSEVHDAVFSSDSNYTITYWNQAAEKMFGWTKEEALGKNSGQLLKPKVESSSLDNEEIKAEKHRLLERGSTVYPKGWDVRLSGS